jgi:hypothetical protein
VEGCYEHGDESSDSVKGGKFVTSCATICFLRRNLPHGVSL